MDDGAGKTGSSDTGQALEMLTAFASVGAKVFDLSFTGLDRKPVKGMQRPGRSLEDMRRRIGRDLQDAERNRHNVIIRPRSTKTLRLSGLNRTLVDSGRLRATRRPSTSQTVTPSPFGKQTAR